MAKTLRIIAIVLMALTAVITIASGIGTRCAAWGTPEELAEWGMTELLPYQGQYQLFVYLTILAGIAQAVFFVGLIVGKKWGYIGGLISLIAGIIVAAIHVATSRSLRGSSMPNDMRLYASILTLLVMLALRLPGLWGKLPYSGASRDEPGAGAMPAAMALVLAGLTLATTPAWVQATHIIGGYNWADILRVPLLAAGAGLALAGAALLAAPMLRRRPASSQVSEESAAVVR
jgi:hypothetical protein